MQSFVQDGMQTEGIRMSTNKSRILRLLSYLYHYTDEDHPITTEEIIEKYSSDGEILNRKTVHEFPAYSSVLGDLHAHYVNLIFVIAVTAVAVAWAMNVSMKRQETRPVTAKPAAGRGNGIGRGEAAAVTDGTGRALWKEVLFEGVLRPEILMIAVMTGAFRWTNFWDFPIYVVVCGAVVMFTDLRLYKGDGKRFLAVLASQTATVFLAGYLAALPFTATFDQISTEIHPTTSHTLLYQLIILWGLPVAVSLGYIVSLAVPAVRKADRKSVV